MAQPRRITMSIDDIKPGMVIRTKSSRATQTRQVYKIQTFWGTNRKEWYSTIWSILVAFNRKTGQWEEEPTMVTNCITSVTHLSEVVNGVVVHTPLTVDERKPQEGHK